MSNKKETPGWDEVLQLAEKHKLIVQAYGGVAVIATYEEQEKNVL